MKIEIESDALDSLKRMVEELKCDRQNLLDAHHEILMVHGDDNNRPKAFYISADACDAAMSHEQSICDWQDKMPMKHE